MEFIKEKDRIYLEDNQGKVMAEITFHEIQRGIFNIDHTFVDASLRGKGIAGKLVQEAVNLIKEKQATIEATCSYAKNWLEKHKQEL